MVLMNIYAIYIYIYILYYFSINAVFHVKIGSMPLKSDF